VASSKAKTLEVARLSIAQYFRRNLDADRAVYFWTFSEPGRAAGESLWTKDEAEAHFKPFRDLCARRGIELIAVWERQDRGAWHPHCLVNRYLDVNRVRPWMMARGWGPQMRVEQVRIDRVYVTEGGVSGWKTTCEGGRWIVRYLTKYLTKGMQGDLSTKKKLFSGSARVKAGTTRFKWLPHIKAGAYLFAAGIELFAVLYGRPPKFRDMATVIRIGVEETGWAAIDPWWEFSVPAG